MGAMRFRAGGSHPNKRELPTLEYGDNDAFDRLHYNLFRSVIEFLVFDIADALWFYSRSLSLMIE